MRPALLCLTMGMAILGAGAVAVGDTLYTKDGRTLQGRVTDQKDGKIYFEVDQPGVRMNVTFDAQDVRSVVPGELPPAQPVQTRVAKTGDAATRPAEAGTATQPAPGEKTGRYYVLSLSGEVGIDIKAALLEKALKEARPRRPDHLVLLIDSPGGTLSETQEILKVLSDLKDLRPIALVRRALSSAAIIAMACPRIYMLPEGTMGAAVPYQLKPDGTKTPLDEKQFSALRAMARSASEIGGHEPLLMEGMMELDLELTLVTKDGVVAVVSGGGGKPVKARGKVLTLTAKEAVEVGLAAEVVDGEADLGKSLGFEKWFDVTGSGRREMEVWVKQERRKEENKAYLETIAPKLAQIDTDLGKVRVEGRTAEATKTETARQYDAEVAAAKNEFNRANGEALLMMSMNRTAAVNRANQAKATYDAKMTDINNRYRAPATALQERINRLNNEQQRLLKQRKDLIDAGPK